MNEIRQARGGHMLRRLLSLSATHIITIGGGLISAVIWTRMMPKEIYGEYRVVLSILSFFGTFCYIGIGQAILKSAAREFDGNLAILTSMKSRANMVGALGILCVAVYYAFGRNESNGVWSALIVAAVFFSAYNRADIWTAWLNGKSRFKELALGRMASTLVPLFSLLAAVLVGFSELWVIVAFTFAAISLLNFGMLRLVRRHCVTGTTDQATIAYAHHATVAMSFGAVLVLDTAVLEHFFGAAEVAIYAVALLLPDQLKALVGLINQAVAPTVYGATSLRKLLQELKPLFVKLAIASLGIGVVGFLMFPFLIGFLFSDAYSQSGEVGKWLWLVSAITSPINTFIGSIILSRQHKARTYIGGVGYPMLLIVFSIVFIDMGAEGFVLAKIIVYLITAIFHSVTILWLLRQEASGRNRPVT